MTDCCEDDDRQRRPLAKSIMAPHESLPGSFGAYGCLDKDSPANAIASAVGLGREAEICFHGHRAHSSDLHNTTQCTPLCCIEKRPFHGNKHIALQMGCCAEKSCCSSKSREVSNKKVPEVSEASECQSNIKLEDGPSLGTLNIESDASLKIQEITLSVKGMTCTGCEKTLRKALTSITGVSDIRTNLLLAQAEFNLQESVSYHTENIAQIIEAKTGFSCKKVEHEGEKLDLVIPPNISRLSGAPPNGIISLKYASTQLLVSYSPKIIGARDLCSHPFFESAQLSPPSPPPVVAAGRAQFRKELYMTILSALLTTPVLVLAYAHLPKREILYGAISLFLATIVQCVVAGEFYVKAFRTLIVTRMAEMDMLVVLSSTTAYVYSVIAYGFLVAGNPLPTGQFFETSTLLVTLIMIGRTVATFSRQSAVESISIESLQEQTAIVLDPAGKKETIDARLLQYGDIFKVVPDTVIVTDGIIIEGSTEVDESMVTGEATLITKQPGDLVIAGSLNQSGTILVRLTRLPSENTIKTISAMVDEAQSSKPRVQEIADQVAGYFTYGILCITMLVLIVWVGIGKGIRHQNTSTACINAMTFAISTLIVSCPCAIGLAVPMVVLIAGGVGARHGLIFKTGESLEIARKVTHVVFDKTGTLTEGNLSVIEEEYLDTSDSTLPLIMGMTANSNHPVSRAIHSHLNSKDIKPTPNMQVTSIPGSGLEATWNDHTIRAGSSHWLSLTKHTTVIRLLSLCLTTLCITLDERLIAIYGLRDTLRPSALPLINELKSRGIAISLVSGDNVSSVYALATHIGIPKENVRAAYHPAQKAEYVRSLLHPSPSNTRAVRWLSGLWRGKTKKEETVLFIGDGTNDAPALAAASIGVSISSLTPQPTSTSSPTMKTNGSSNANTNTSSMSATAASILLIHPSLTPLITLISLSAAFHRRVVFNFAWSAVYNLFAILLAAGAFQSLGGGGGVRIPPMYAGLGECVSVVPVVLVAVGLRWVRL